MNIEKQNRIRKSTKYVPSIKGVNVPLVTSQCSDVSLKTFAEDASKINNNKIISPIITRIIILNYRCSNYRVVIQY